jgi:hypothetical protein
MYTVHTHAADTSLAAAPRMDQRDGGTYTYVHARTRTYTYVHTYTHCVIVHAGGTGAGALTSTLMAACRGSVYRTSRPPSGERDATAPGAGDRISSPPARPTTNITTTDSSADLTRADGREQR